MANLFKSKSGVNLARAVFCPVNYDWDRFVRIALFIAAVFCVCCGAPAEVMCNVRRTNSGVVLKRICRTPDKKSDRPMPLAVFVHGVVATWERAGGDFVEHGSGGIEHSRLCRCVGRLPISAGIHGWLLFMNDAAFRPGFYARTQRNITSTQSTSARGTRWAGISGCDVRDG